MKVFLVPGAVTLLLAAATVAPAALHLSEWHVAGSAFDAAVVAAQEAGESSVDARTVLETARDAAAPALDDASAVASAGVGYLSAASLSALTTSIAEMTDALAVEPAQAEALPTLERPDTVAALRESTESLDAWRKTEATRSAALGGEAERITELGSSVEAATRVAVESVTVESGAALAVAPLASADSRAGLEAARDALLAAAKDRAPLGDAVRNYATAVEAAFTSQRAEAQARAEAEAEAADQAARAARRAELQQQLHELFLEQSGYDESDCVPIDNGWACGGLP